MKHKNPKVSVIMGFFNCETTLAESLNSIIDQTYQDFNVIICDDGSTDRSYDIASEFCKKYPDKFVLLKNTKNMGLNYTLNVCLKHCTGIYIARMDGDDISLPNRFSSQVDFLDTHEEFHIVSSSMIYFDEIGDWGLSTPAEYPKTKDIVKGTPFAHAPCMVRSEAFDMVGGYSVHPRLIRVEDYHLWIKMYSKGLKGYNIQEPLYKMRDDKMAIKRRNIRARLNEAYVKVIAINELKLSKCEVIHVFKPLILALVPDVLYNMMHKYKLRLKINKSLKVDI